MERTHRTRAFLPADEIPLAGIYAAAWKDLGYTIPAEAVCAHRVGDEFPGLNDRFYTVEDRQGRVVGGGGFHAAGLGGDSSHARTCVLSRVYFDRSARGQGLGLDLVVRLLREAKVLGYQYCYLGSMAGMRDARRMYEGLGFELIGSPIPGRDQYDYRLNLADFPDSGPILRHPPQTEA